MALDAFLELKQGNSPIIEGETLDSVFAKKKAMSILSFTLETESDSKKKKKKKKGEQAVEEEEDDDDTEESTIPRPGSGLQVSGTDENAKRPKCPLTFTVTKEVDKASTQLFMSYCRHADEEILWERGDEFKPFDAAIITLRKAGSPNPVVFLVLEFNTVVVNSFSIKSEGDKLPVESISFGFRKCTMQYRPQTARGFGSAKITTWDFDLPPDEQ